MSEQSEHAATICSSFTDHASWAECSCGWKGAPARGVVAGHSRHLAMADWAAHAHVAAGLAVPDPAPDPREADQP